MSKESLDKALLKKAEQVRAGAQALMEKTSDWQVIQQYLCNRIKDIKLNPEQEKKLRRYEFVYNQLVSGRYTDTEVVSQLMNIHKVAMVQAYEDIRNAREIFGTVININKQFEVKIQLQVNRDMLRKASELNDLKAYAALEKNRQKLLDMLPDEETNPGELFEGHEIEAVFNPKLLGAPDISNEELVALMKAINAKRGKKINMDLFVEDIPHEEVP